MIGTLISRRGLVCAGLLALGLGASAAQPVRSAKLRVVTTRPVLAEAARAIGGPLVTVESLADPRQNPHFVDPRPTLMQRARKADVFVIVGLELEPWARRVAAGSGNAAIQQGQPGHIVASQGLTTMEVPSRVTREEGSIHPYGNPYVWLDPLNLKHMAENIAEGLARLDPAHADDYERGLAGYADRIDRALFGDGLVDEVGGDKLTRLARQGRLDDFLEDRGLGPKLGGWLDAARPLEGVSIVSQHKTWIYFATRFGFQVAMEIEEKPGIQPSARHRDRVLETMQARSIKTILIERYQDRRTADWIAKRAGAEVLAVPVDVGPEVEVDDYFALIDLLLEELVDSRPGG